METMNKQVLRAIEPNIIKVLNEKFPEFDFRFSGGRFDSTSATLKLVLSTKGADGIVLSHDRNDYEKYHGLYNLKPEWLDKTFTSNGKTYKVTGLAMNRRKYPVTVEVNGKSMLMTAESVIRGFAAAEKK